MRPYIARFEFDDFNSEEMAKHGVTEREVNQVLNGENPRIVRNKNEHAEKQPYVMIGLTDGGRKLYIPIGPVDSEPGLWRPATAWTP